MRPKIRVSATWGRTSWDLFFLAKGCLGKRKIMVVNLRSAHNISKITFYECHRCLGNESQHDWFCIIFGHIMIYIHKLFIHYTYMCWVTACVSAKGLILPKDLHLIISYGHTPNLSSTSNECSSNTLCLHILVWCWRKGVKAQIFHWQNFCSMWFPICWLHIANFSNQ